MRLSSRYGTHLPVLMQAIYKTKGTVLELGVGPYSTPILHRLCALEGRHVLSVDNSPEFYGWAKRYESRLHRVVLVEDWDKAKIEYAWDVALVDHSPSERRVVEIHRLAKRVKYLVLHDANGRYEAFYHYSKIYALFKYMITFDDVEPSTVLLSNLVSLKDFWKRP